MLDEARRRLPAARTALAIAIGDMPCSGTSQGGSGTSDRTGRIALGVIEGVDTAWTDSRELDRLERIIIAKCNDGLSWTYLLPRVLDIVDRWAPAPSRKRKLDDNLRAAAADLLNKTDDHGNCTSCKRDPLSHSDPFRRGLCVNCYRRVERINELYVEPVELPPVALVVLLRERGKVTERDIHNAMSGHTRRDA
jgi:hypothetical protein